MVTTAGIHTRHNEREENPKSEKIKVGEGGHKLSINNFLYREALKNQNDLAQQHPQTACLYLGNTKICAPRPSFPVHPSSYPSPNFSPNPEFKTPNPNKNFPKSWIFDCEATHTMTFDSRDILSHDPTIVWMVKA